MTTNKGKDRSLTDVFGDMQLSDTECLVAHQEDPCKMPQSAPNDSCDDAGDISSIIVVDSDASPEISFIDPGDLIYSVCGEDSNDNLAITIEETESEAADEHAGSAGLTSPLSDPVVAIGPGTTTSAVDMNTARSSMSSKSALKRSTYSLSDDNSETKKLMEEMTALSSSPKVVTRSGRAVRMRLDKKFDYSSSQPEDDETEEPNWSSPKRRRSSHGSSRTNSSTGSSSQMEGTLIYLDLEPSVATIMHEPLENLVLDDDDDLKTKIHKFLGLIPRRRKLYNPEDHLQPDDPPQKEVAPSRSFLQITSAPAQPVNSGPPQVPPSPKPTPTRLNASHHKMLNDTMLLGNAFTIETETPDYIQEPIDLTDLPSEKFRANNCRRHKSCIACLEQDPQLYSFVDSLNPVSSLKLCHPQALPYRKRDFESCKQALAKNLFNMFNHAIFHCALQPDIVWQRSLGKPCRCEMTIDSSGQRSARFLLWQNINHSRMLIKPLLHEMCHAAAFVFNRETGHGQACRQWAYQANQQLTELTLIDVCDARFKYVCSMCGRGSYGLMDFGMDKDMLRCHYCQFEVVAEPWSADCLYDCIRPDTTMTEFKNFIFDKYQQLTDQEGGTSHSTKMRCLNQQYLKIKL
ncbi:uncharacterized protein LOC110181821 isoform X2 [Drosophila serrata]|uniref:uncharacterized protein LOC110181821 isoform X2 n=1 Tax=Drosophila serrata TaxID=7274 RepID=UPI000A1D1B48|nr:uncharacterized protein LOC110181821 isoform X2 [Drosophila serrata]